MGPLFGRADALRRLDDTLADGGHRWVSVVGLGGVGKSTLVLDWLERQSGAHAFCRLDQAGAATLRLALAAALGAPAPGPALERLAADLSLLVLDGAEVLSDEELRWLEEWRASPAVPTIVATSRRPLRVADEYLIRLEPLALPKMDDPPEEVAASPAVAMLLDRMSRLGAEEPRALAPVVRLTRALGGLPLGLELCARTASLLGPAEALERFGDMVALPDPRRASDDRQTSLQRVLDTTWEECPAWIRAGLAQASVFETAFTIGAAEAVLELPEETSALALLHELLDRSLLQVERAPDSERRFRLHGLIRHAAASRRRDERALRLRHERYFLAELAQERLRDPFPDAKGQRRFLLESPDILAACAHARSDRDVTPDRLAQLALVARAFFLAGIRLPDLDGLIERVTQPAVLHALGSAGASSIAELVGVVRSWAKDEGAEGWLRRAVQLAEESGDPELRFGALMRQAHQHLSLAETDAARAQVEAMRGLLPKLGEAKWGGWVMALSAIVERHRDEVPWLEAQLREAGRILAGAGAPEASLGWIQARMTDLLLDDGRYEAALTAALEALELTRANPQLSAYLRLLEALARIGLEDFDGAEAVVETLEESASEDESIRRFSVVARASQHLRRRCWGEAMIDFEVLSQLPVEGGDAGSVAVVQLGLAVAATHAGAPERARRALEVAAEHIADRDPKGPFARVHARSAAALTGRPLPAMPAFRPTQMPTVAAVLRIISEAAAEGQEPTLEVGLDGAWFRWAHSPPVSMTRRPVLQRVFWALVELRRDEPGAMLSTDELFEHGWPGETIDVGSARNRARVALARLRKLGLDAVVERLPEGVRIRPAVTVTRVAGPPPNGR